LITTPSIETIIFGMADSCLFLNFQSPRYFPSILDKSPRLTESSFA
jgi:hypothetical protein